MRRIAGSPRLMMARRRNVRWVTEGTFRTLGVERAMVPIWSSCTPHVAGGAGSSGGASRRGADLGGTDVMVELNFARRRPTCCSTSRGDELSRWEAADGWVRIGAGVSYTRVIDDSAARCRGWRWRRGRSAHRRSAIGGRSGGTSDPPRRRAMPCRRCSRLGRRRSGVRARLAAIAGRASSSSVRSQRVGRRRADRGGLDAGARRRGQQFAKVGTRNAMVIAVCSFALDRVG